MWSNEELLLSTIGTYEAQCIQPKLSKIIFTEITLANDYLESYTLSKDGVKFH